MTAGTVSPVQAGAALQSAPQPRAPVPRWLAVVTHTDPRYGGLSTAVPRIGLAVEDTGRAEMSLAAFCVENEHTRPAGYDDDHLSFWPTSRAAWLRSAALRSSFARSLGAFEGVHIHGLWEASTLIASRAARTQDKPYLVSAHGMLEPWALATKRWKKLLYARLVERGILARAACLHALTRAEAEQYRAFGVRTPIAIVANAVDVPEKLCPELFLAAYPHLRQRRVVLFLGRLHPKKGLKLLAQAWNEICRAYPDAHLVLAGPDDGITRAEFLAEIDAQGHANTATFTGMLGETLKWSALAAAECFVLPSFSEGLSMGVLEALGAGTPVIVTRNCNMPEVAQYKAGWVIEPDAMELRNALNDLLQATPEENRAAGARGAALVTSRYNPRHVAQQLADVYEYIQNGIPPVSAELLL